MRPHFERIGILQPAESLAYAASDGGVFRSSDNGRSWKQLTNIKEKDDQKKFLSSDVFEVQFMPDNPDVIYMATNHGAYVSVNSGDEWRPFISGALGTGDPVYAIAIDPENPQRMYITATSASGGRILKSQGLGFYVVHSTIDKLDSVLGIWVDPFSANTLYAGTNSGLFLMSSDYGESWEVRKEFSEPVRDLKMLPSDTRVLYATVGIGNIFKSANQGISWQNISTSLTRKYKEDFNINQLIIDPHNESRLYLATNFGLLMSENSGASFSEIELLVAGPNPEISAAGLDPNMPDVIYIGVNSQIHKSIDGGKSWQSQKLNTPRFVNAINVKPNDSGVIFAGVSYK
jgi:photosystem II stability/assembly factor-like uncharacterized protein